MSEIRMLSDREQRAHLKAVSRTFALTIPMLHGDLADWVANAYLLCRIADTVEDDSVADPKAKTLWLNDFADLARNGFAGTAEDLGRLRDRALELTAGGSVAADRALLQDFGAVIARTRSFPREAVTVIARGVAILSAGMAEAIAGVSIKSQDDLDRYCYSVAGVVGETLAGLFGAGLEDAQAARLYTLSVSFGEALQLTNILKDRSDDLGRGVRFIPLEPGEDEAGRILGILALTCGHLLDAGDFIAAVPHRRPGVRLFCFLNVAMAALTLRRIAASPLGSPAQLKISRRAVRTLVLLGPILVLSNHVLRLTLKLLLPDVAAVRRDPAALRATWSRWVQQP